MKTFDCKTEWKQWQNTKCVFIFPLMWCSKEIMSFCWQLDIVLWIHTKHTHGHTANSIPQYIWWCDCLLCIINYEMILTRDTVLFSQAKSLKTKVKQKKKKQCHLLKFRAYCFWLIHQSVMYWCVCVYVLFCSCSY